MQPFISFRRIITIHNFSIMQQLITIYDESQIGKVSNQLEICLTESTISAAELIRLRIYAEVEEFNQHFQTSDCFYGLVQPSETERILNGGRVGFKLNSRREIDPEKQALLALAAFKKNAYFLLVDDKQVGELSEMINLTERSKVTFLKLTPLVGG